MLCTVKLTGEKQTIVELLQLMESEGIETEVVSSIQSVEEERGELTLDDLTAWRRYVSQTLHLSFGTLGSFLDASMEAGREWTTDLIEENFLELKKYTSVKDVLMEPEFCQLPSGRIFSWNHSSSPTPNVNSKN